MTKISELQLTIFRRPTSGSEHMRIKSMSTFRAEALLVQLVDEDGRKGECFAPAAEPHGLAMFMANYVRPFVVGRDPADREALWQEHFRRGRLNWEPPFATALLDICLWDLYGKQVEQPVYKLLGAYRDKIPTYCSSMTKGSVEGYVDEALEFRERGFQGYKIHVPGNPDEDIRICTAVRAAVGDQYPLMIDSVAAYNQIEALRVGKVVEELGFLWYEEPLRDYDLHGYRWLCDKLSVPVMSGEVNEGHLYTVSEYITTRATDIVRACVSFKGGISQVKKIGSLAEAFGMNIEVHANPWHTLDVANLHCELSFPNTMFHEQLMPIEFRQAGVRDPLHIDAEGFVHAPTGPGLGMEIDDEMVTSGFVATY